MVLARKLSHYANDYLKVAEFKDYCPNGLQVQGKSEIKKIVGGVSLNDELIDKAIKSNADAILVHHGLLWHKETLEIVGIKKERLRKLIMHEINLYAYHLPLDVHPLFGNNAFFVQALKLNNIMKKSLFGTRDLLWFGELSHPVNPTKLAINLEEVFCQKSIYAPAKDTSDIKKIAWCTGAAQDGIECAANESIDAFVTGEISERTYHLARELNVHFFAVGHHASERFGVDSFGKHLADHFGLEYEFINVYNPI